MTDNAGNVKPWIEESREDATEVVISRMEDGNAPAGEKLSSADASSRMEDVQPSRARIRGKRSS